MQGKGIYHIIKCKRYIRRCLNGDYNSIAGHCNVSCKAKYGNGDTLREVDK